MPGIRVQDIPAKCENRDLKIYFSKPENGGGHVERIFYPLLNNDAVIIFKDPQTVLTVLEKKDHIIKGTEIYAVELPVPEVFTEVEAKLDPSVAALIQATDEIKDEIQHIIGVELCYDETGCLIGVRGYWFMLECFWAHIDKISKQQGRARRRHLQLKSEMNEQDREMRSYPMEIDHQVISMPSGSNIATEGHSSHEDNEINEVSKVQKEPKAKKSKKVVAAVKDKRFGKIEHLEEDMDNNIGQIASLNIGESESRDSEKKGTDGKGTDNRQSERNDDDIVILGSKPDDVRSLDFRYGPLNVSVYTGWITMVETDAIVNAANGGLQHYGGIADVIAKAAGPEMEEQCRKYTIKNGSVPTTEVMHTCAGGEINEKVKYIMHAVGPIWSSLNDRRCAQELTKTFLNTLVYGNDVLKIHSVTMPVISSGVFGCPLELCIRSFLNAVLLFASERMFDFIHLKEVNLVNKNSDNTAMSVIQLRDLISQGAPVLVHEAQQQLCQKFESYEAIRVQSKPLSVDRDTDITMSDRYLSSRPVTKETSDLNYPYRSPSYGREMGKSSAVGSLGSVTRGLHTAHEYESSAAAGINSTKISARDGRTDINRHYNTKPFDLSIRNQDLIGTSVTVKPYGSDLSLGMSGSYAKDGSFNSAMSHIGETRSERTPKTRMTPPPTKSYRTEETSFLNTMTSYRGNRRY